MIRFIIEHYGEAILIIIAIIAFIAITVVLVGTSSTAQSSVIGKAIIDLVNSLTTKASAGL